MRSHRLGRATWRRRVVGVALSFLGVACGEARAPRARMQRLTETRFQLQTEPPNAEGQAQLVSGVSGASPLEAAEVAFEQALEQSGTPGAAVALLLEGELVFTRGFGVKHARTLEPVTPDTLFRTASISKPLLALAAMRLVERNKLSLHAGITGPVPYFRRGRGSEAHAVTLGQLLTHTAGIPDASVAPCASDQQAIRDYFDSRGADPLWSPPGWFHNYSNNGYALLGAAVSEAAGLPFPQAMSTLVFAPLGMPSTTYDGHDVETRDHATGHDANRKPLPFPPQDCEAAQAAGGVYTNVVEFAEVLRMLMAEGGEYLSEASFSLMTTPVLDEAERSTRRVSPEQEASPKSGYGLGFQIHEQRGARVISHAGLSIGFTAYFAVVPQHGMAAVAFANAHLAPVQTWCRVIDDLIDQATITKPALGNAPPSWDKYLGDYVDPHGWLANVRIVKEQADYFLELHGGQPYPISILEQLTGELREGPDGQNYMITRIGVGRHSP